MSQRKTNLFVVGAMKAGTTSFAQLLSNHPEIYCPPVKEPHYFVKDLPKRLYEPGRFFSLKNYFEKEFPKPLHITKTQTVGQYQKIYSLAANQKYLADTSTAYLHAPESAELIHQYNPGARLIVLVRDPLKRAFSHYQMDLGKGREKRSFEKVMRAEIERYEAGELLWNSYLGMSFYDQAVGRFTTLFGKPLILKFEEFVAEPKKVIQLVSQFLEVAPFDLVEDTHKNVSRSLRFQKLFYFLKRMGLKDYFSKLFSAEFKQWIFRRVSSDKKSDMGLSQETTMKLKSIFAKESGQCYY